MQTFGRPISSRQTIERYEIETDAVNNGKPDRTTKSRNKRNIGVAIATTRPGLVCPF